MRLSSNEQYAIVRKLADHTDSGTYYVRAVVRDARSDTIIDTVNLDDKGGQRFSKQYQVPADTSGVGKYITIETSVYTDSGYTTKSTSYGDEIVTLQIKDERFGGGGGGGGPEVNYDKIKKMVEDVVGKNKVEIPETDVQGPLAAVRDQVISVIRENRTTPTPPTDLAPVMEAIQRAMESVLTAVDNKEIPEPEKIDYGKLESAATKTLEQQKVVLTKIQAAFKGLEDTVAEAQKDVAGKLEAMPTPAVVVAKDSNLGALLGSEEKKVEEKPEKPEPKKKFKGIRI